jgi:hypothetical protein
MATCAVSGNIVDPSGTALLSVTVAARVNQPVFSSTTLIAPEMISTVTDASGNFTLTVQQSISVIFTVTYPVIGTEPMRSYEYTGNIPATTTANFSSVIVNE